MNQESRKIKSFTDLFAWQEGHKLVLEIYQKTITFPREELFGLTSQMRRSAASITANLAEGFSRQSYKDKLRFYFISQGSVTELQDQLLIARDIKYINLQEFKNLAIQAITVHKIINGLIKSTKEIVKNTPIS